MFSCKTLCPALLLLALGGGVHAEAYKSVDENGVVEYSQLPPPGRDSTPIRTDVPGAAPPPAAPSGNQPAPREVEQAAKPEQAPAPELTLEQSCKQARKNLETLENHPRIVVRDEKGETKRLTEEERQQHITDLRAQIKQYCEE